MEPDNKPIYRKLWPFLALFLVLFFIALLPLLYNGALIYIQARALDATVNRTVAAAKAGNLSGVSNELNSAKNNLVEIKSRAKKAGPILLIPSVAKSSRTVDQLIGASIDLVDGYRQLIGVFDSLLATTEEGKVAADFSTPEGKKKILALIVENRQTLEEAKTKIKQARLEIAAINTDDLSGIFQSKVNAANNIISEVVGNSETALPLFKYLPELAGYQQEKAYLLLFENNMELRPTGGFIGSYGIVKVKDGNISSIVTDDIYNLDKLVKDKLKVPAPWPLSQYTSQKYLFLRDANWSPDWPTSAQKIKWYFDTERQMAGLPPQPLDGVIAITPDFIANFLAITGPITIDGITFDTKNFTNELEQAVEFDFAQRGVDIAQRKNIIGDLSRDLIKRLTNASAGDLLDLWKIMRNNIEEKQIIAWLADTQLQEYFSDENFAGEVKAAPDDYFYLVDANIAALKTDSVMTRDVGYRVNVANNGDLYAHFEITYHHNGKVIPGLIGQYRTYARLYVPTGSWFNRAVLRDADGREKELDMVKDVVIGNELGKRFAGVYLTVDPGASRTLILEYRLPDSVKQAYKAGEYSLLAQKQPGTPGHSLKIDLRFDQQIKSYHSEVKPSVFGGDNLGFSTNLKVDRQVEVKF